MRWISPTEIGSTPANGSSSRIRRGCAASARAISQRRRSPPDRLAPFRCNVTMAAKGREINAKSIMGVMLLAAGQGTPVTVRINGEDEAAAMEAVVGLFERRFDEDS